LISWQGLERLWEGGLAVARKGNDEGIKGGIHHLNMAGGDRAPVEKKDGQGRL